MFDDLLEYMKSLFRLRDLINNRNNNNNNNNISNSNNNRIERLYPGHGPIITNAIEKIDEYISHRSIREKQIVDVLDNNNNWISALEVVDKVYGPLHPFIRISALTTTTQHLVKLQQQQQVENKWPDLWRRKHNNNSNNNNNNNNKM